MRCLLFRKLLIDDVTYYQLYKIEEDFQNTDNLLSSEHRDTCDYFYIENDEKEIIKSDINNIWYEKDNDMVRYDGDELGKIIDGFNEKYHASIMVKKIKTIDELSNILGNNILFNDKNIYRFIKQIYMNQSILDSNLPYEIKNNLKSNILLHGFHGTGKNTIVNLLKENIDFPYADIKIEKDLSININDIILSLLNTSISDEEASRGIVFVRDNFDEILSYFDGNKNAYACIDYLTKQGIIHYNNHTIDFNKLTFVVLFNYDFEMDKDDLSDLCSLLNCNFDVKLKPLTNKEKYYALFSDNGRIKIYNDYIKRCGKKLYVCEKSLKKLISFASKQENGMSLLNNMIDMIMKRAINNSVNQKGRNIINDVYINSLVVEDLISSYPLNEEKIDENEQEEKTENISPLGSKLEKINEIHREVSKYVINQDGPMRRILGVLLNNYEMANKKDLLFPEKYIQKILIQAESGSGKTLMMKSIANYINIPIKIVDATKYTEAGFKGGDVEEMLVDLYNSAGKDKEKAQRGILVIDEIDKKANNFNSDVDISRGAVLNALLTFFDGDTITINVIDKYGEKKEIGFDTSRLTIMCSGAFEGIEKIRNQRIKRMNGGMGFSNVEISENDKKITYSDYVDYGMMNQFVGRFPIIINLNKNTKESLINIMKNSKVSALKIFKEIYENDGIELVFTDDFCEKVAERALKMKIGARAIESILENVKTDINIQEIDPKIYSKIVFNGDVLDDPSKIILEKREEVKTKRLTGKN